MPHADAPAADAWLANASVALENLAVRDPAGAWRTSTCSRRRGVVLCGETVAGIVRRWQQTDPATARAWVDQLPDVRRIDGF